MAVIKNSPFESKYGFKSPNFTVDEDGNITATSINLAIQDDTTTNIVDFTVSENLTNTEFLIAGYEGENPTISLRRTRTYTFEINVPNLTFSFYDQNLNAYYTSGVIHSDGSVGEEAIEKTTGLYSFRVPIDAPDTLSYIGVDELGEEVRGSILILDPAGLFGTLEVTANTESSSIDTGALTVAGGVGIVGNLYVGETLTANQINLDGLGVPALNSSTNLELGATNQIVIKVENVLVGTIGSEGSTIPINNTRIENTVIGETTPSTANFVSATIADVPTTGTGAANKAYVDQTATALAVAFGL